ncbi:MAG TPA: hypothetical protein VMN58_05955 [Acidimicrobiales bacterium]|nr:hypothetical protein [Acidimicrobiales bacterium]
MLVRAVVALATLGALPLITAPPAVAQSTADAVEACDPLTAVPEAGPRTCGGLERAIWLAAQHCRRVPPAQEPVCPSIDGRPVHESAMQAYEQGWVARALDLQRELDLDVPLLEALIPSTHNSGNSTAYDPSLTINDANQVVSVTDQLRLGMRGIEIDLHWTPHPTGDPEHGFRAVVQCHGQSAQTPAGSVHPGCSVDRTFDDHLAELAAWFERPEAEGELVVLYLENQLDGSDAAHASAVESLDRHLGDLLYRPEPNADCQDLPLTRTKRELLAGGAQVLVTGNCGPAGWTDFVFQRGGVWKEGGSVTDYLAGTTCEAEREARDYENTFVRRFEDSTFLSLMVNGGSHISPEVAASMVRCGVNFPGLDQIHPGDERLPALVWSWRDDADPDDPAAACAAQGDDGRFDSRPCESALPVACRTADGGWVASTQPAAWADGELACQADGHAGAGVPANGWDNELLRQATDGLGDVWLAYARQAQADGSERWTVGIPERDPDADAGGDDDGPGRRPLDPGRADHAGPPPGVRGPGGERDAVTGVDLARTSYSGDPRTAHHPWVAGIAVLLVVGLTGLGTRRRRAA